MRPVRSRHCRTGERRPYLSAMRYEAGSGRRLASMVWMSHRKGPRHPHYVGMPMLDHIALLALAIASTDGRRDRAAFRRSFGDLYRTLTPIGPLLRSTSLPNG